MSARAKPDHSTRRRAGAAKLRVVSEVNGVLIAEEEMAVGWLLDGDGYRWLELTADHFHEPRHRIIFAAVSALHDKQQPHDVATVVASLEFSGTLADAGGANVVQRLADETCATEQSIGAYVATLRERTARTEEPQALAAELPPGVSDDELALRFTERHAEELRYVPAWDRWLIWDGRRWAHDEKRRTFDLARALCRAVLAEQRAAETLTEAQSKALANRLGSAATVYAVARLAGSDPRHAVSVKQLDADPWMLNTPGGILDLRTGELRPHEPAALHTKITAATPGGDCPLFRSILERVQPEQSVREYIQRLVGYGMTGSSRDHVLAFWHGGGRNGKGTVAHAIRRALGDYGLEIPAETLMESHHDRHLTEIAVLHGARLVVGSEIDSGRRWNESRLKRLTGGDPISARYIGKDLFEFEPTHTLLIVGNAKPGLRSVDEAIRARMHLVEWEVTIPVEERDTTLSERLASEYGGILAWALAGCLDWQSSGLAPPETVQADTAAYLAGEDMLQAWVQECCHTSGQLTLAAAHRSYRVWCERSGAVVLGRNTFGDQLEAHGFKRAKESRSGNSLFIGLSLPVEPDPRFPE